MLNNDVRILNLQCREALDVAMNEARRYVGKPGIFRSRGKWVIVTRVDGGEPFLANGQLEWKGTRKQLNELLEQYITNPDVSGMYIDGGVDYAESIRAFGEGWYDPWVSEWTVAIFTREDWAKNA